MLVAKLLSEANQKDTRIRQLEKIEKKASMDKDKFLSQEQQIKVLAEQLKSMQTDRDFA
jgi:uncharacterized protein YbaP (TraB family)